MPETCRCRHPGKPLDVEVTDTLTREPEVARTVCTKCWHLARKPDAYRPPLVVAPAVRPMLSSPLPLWVRIIGGIGAVATLVGFALLVVALIVVVFAGVF